MLFCIHKYELNMRFYIQGRETFTLISIYYTNFSFMLLSCARYRKVVHKQAPT